MSDALQVPIAVFFDATLDVAARSPQGSPPISLIGNGYSRDGHGVLLR